MAWAASCGGLGEPPANADGPSIVVQVETSAVVELRWADGEGGAVRTPAGQGLRQVELRRRFATLEEARAFEGTFVVVQAGIEVARETVRFDACDRVQSYGLDPAGITAVVFGRSLMDRWEAETHLANRGPLGCYGTSSSLASNRDAHSYRAIFNLPLAAGIASFESQGETVVPASLQLWDDHAVYVLDLDFPSSLPLTTTLTDLQVAVGGAPRGSVPVSFAKCAAADPAAFAQEEQWLKLPDDGSAGVAIDIYGGFLCMNRDGSGFGGIP